MAAQKKGMMVAKVACVIAVDARPIEYAKVKTRNRDGELVEIDNQSADPIDPGSAGRLYTFKAFQKVNPNHEAVKAAPNRFMPLSEVEEDDLEAVTSG